ncbi:MAG: hypothetical protein HYX68_12135 [Planctomycetes bacterium]|nr:hypothetical protein [Planctomycetota bacterium]
MTRETKVGLIVAGSFLILVGVVVVSKWRPGDEVSGQEEQSPGQVAAVKKTEKDAKKAAPVKKPNAPAPKAKTGTIVIRPSEEKGAKPGTLELPPNLPPLSFPSATNPQNINDDVLRQALAKNQPESKPAPLQLDFGPLPKPNETSGGGTLQVPPLDKGPAIVLSPSGVSDPLPLPGPVKKPEDTSGVPTFPALPNQGGQAAQKDDKKKPVIAPPDAGKPLDLGPLVIPPPVGGGNGNPKTPQVDPLNPAPKDNTLTFPIDPITPQPKNNNPGIAPPKGPAVTIAPPRPADLQPKGFSEIPTIRSNGGNGNGGGPSVPPISLGGASPTLPVVKDVTTDFYVCKPNETNFAIVSQRLYGTEKYADALHAYNKAHYTQVRNGAVFLVDRPPLNAGQEILQPSAAVLERDFRKWIPDLGSSPSPLVPSITPPVKLTTPTPLGSAPIPSAAPVVASGRVYTVQNPNGESILDIAERALGNRTRWYDIHSLNRSYQPQFRIPAGTQLKLP